MLCLEGVREDSTSQGGDRTVGPLLGGRVRGPPRQGPRGVLVQHADALRGVVHRSQAGAPGVYQRGCSGASEPRPSRAGDIHSRGEPVGGVLVEHVDGPLLGARGADLGVRGRGRGQLQRAAVPAVFAVPHPLLQCAGPAERVYSGLLRVLVAAHDYRGQRVYTSRRSRVPSQPMAAIGVAFRAVNGSSAGRDHWYVVVVVAVRFSGEVVTLHSTMRMFALRS